MMYLGKDAVGLVQAKPPRVVLPTGYASLTYLQSSGTQIIDTGIWAKLNSKLVVDGFFLPNGTYVNYLMIAGCQNPPCMISAINACNYPENITTYWAFGNRTDVTLGKNIPCWVRTIWTLDATQMKISPSDYQTTILTKDINATQLQENPNSHICLFGRQNNGVYERFTPCRIYEYWYYESDVLLRHMYPAKRESDNELGMYDVVNNVFYTNAGTGTFIGGDT